MDLACRDFGRRVAVAETSTPGKVSRISPLSRGILYLIARRFSGGRRRRGGNGYSHVTIAI